MCHQIVHNTTGPINIQDTIHIATKLRNRLVNKSLKLMMGSYAVSAEHLTTLIRNKQKSVHCLNMSDASPVDRQNFASAERITKEKVLIALEKFVKNSEGTIKYLKICRDVTSSFLDHHITPLERILRMFRAVYFLRIWRKFIIASRSQTLGKNFLTKNAYDCIEANAKGLIELIKRFRDENAPNLFIVPIFDSQTCEKTFRQLRSMGTVNFTRINFSLYDLLYMIRRTEVQNDIAYFKLAEHEVIFPLSHKRCQKTTVYELPSDHDIIEELKKAKETAVQDALALGMYSDDIDEYEFKTNLDPTIYDESDNELECDDLDDNELEDPLNAENIDPIIPIVDEDETDETITSEQQLNNEHINPGSSFVSVVDENGKNVTIRKSYLIWLLTENGIGSS